MDKPKKQTTTFCKVRQLQDVGSFIIGYSEEEITDDIYKDKLEVLKYGLEQDFNFSTKHIPEEIIDAFVKEIVVCRDCLIWKLF